jgi:hypothetical protein
MLAKFDVVYAARAVALDQHVQADHMP